MSTKRKYIDDGETVHPSRQANFQSSKPAKKARNNNGSGPKPYKTQAHASSVNLIKKKIRDVTRRLDRSEDLPANVKAEDERALEMYKEELAEAENEKVKQAMIKRYHMVRFFERQKATRTIKRLKKALIAATDEEEVARLTKELHIADVDLNYTQYCPLNEVYISIYPQTSSEEDQKDVTKKPEMWREVERRMEDGGLDNLRNGVRTILASRPKPKAQARPSGANSGEVKARVGKSAKDSWSGISDQGGASLVVPKREEAPKSKPITKRMTDDEFYKLNRRQKREVLKKSGALSTAVSRPRDGGADDVEEDEIDDGGFFEE